MPTVQAIDDFDHGDFTVPGGASYSAIVGSPAKDTSVRKGADPASLLLSTGAAAAENVQQLISGSPARPWHGYWFRMAAVDEPAGDLLISNLGAADAAGGQFYYQSSSNKFYHVISGGSEFPLSAVYTHGDWVWIEHILETSLSTRTLYTRIGGVDMTPTNRVVAASSGVDCLLGTTGVATFTNRYSNHYRGSAASVTDWMGEPASGIEKIATMPWEIVGVSAPNVLGLVPTTAGVPLIWESHGWPPSASDDSAAGVGVGDIWIDTVQQSGYVCTSNAVAAAVWKKVTP